jgi:hypothetical protein
MTKLGPTCRSLTLAATLLAGSSLAFAGSGLTVTPSGQQEAAVTTTGHCGWGHLPNCPGQTYCDRIPQPYSCQGNGPAGATQPPCKGPHKGPNGVMIQCD